MPLLAAGAARRGRGRRARNLHVLATRDPLGPVRGQEVELAASDDGLSWTLRFFDPVVLPELALIDESAGPGFRRGPARARRRHRGLPLLRFARARGCRAHQAAHVGTGLAGGHSAAARDFETIRSRVRGREDLVDEMAGAAAAGLVRAHAHAGRGDRAAQRGAARLCGLAAGARPGRGPAGAAAGQRRAGARSGGHHAGERAA